MTTSKDICEDRMSDKVLDRMIDKDLENRNEDSRRKLLENKIQALPTPFLNEMKEILGGEYKDFLDTYKEEKTSAIRINTLKMPLDRFEDLGLFNIDFDRDRIGWSKESYYISGEEFPGKNPLHDAGAYYIQEPSAMSVVGQTEIKSGDKILDLCAAPGGKSTYILSKLNHSGLLVSNEINPSRTKALGENLERFGAINCIISNSDSKNLLKFFKGFFDKIFIDAPCSGQGMFRKDDFAIVDWSEDKVDECVAIQTQLIRDGFEMLKDGGMLVYSTCTFTKRENEYIVESFLKDYPSARLVDMERLWPHRDKGEGHFCARILKSVGHDVEKVMDYKDGILKLEGSYNTKKIKKKTGVKTRFDNNKGDQIRLFENFLKNYLEGDRLGIFKPERLVIKKDSLYYNVLDGDLKGLKLLRRGLIIGEFKKNRFEPSHSLAMVLKTCDVKYSIDFSNASDEARSYLRGESIKTSQSRGWVLVSIEGVSLGWAKESNGILKNKYPKGLRK